MLLPLDLDPVRLAPRVLWLLALGLMGCQPEAAAGPEEQRLVAAAVQPPDVADQLRELTKTCNPVPGTGRFRTDAGKSPTVQLCQLPGAIFWRADADIDCDGQTDPRCAKDPWRQPETSAKGTDGQFINAADVPFLVVPMASEGFEPKAHGIKTGWSGYGSAGVVLYNGRMVFAPYADAGPKGVIGELSFAAAQALGIDPDPVRGGVAEGVTYIVFTGEQAYVKPVEDPVMAREVGLRLARQLVGESQ